MKYIEIDGERIEVHSCKDCPCCDDGDGGYGATCKHPCNSEVTKYGDRYGIFLEDAVCPLRKVKVRYIEVNSCGKSGDCPYYYSDSDFCRHPKLWNSIHSQVCEWDEDKAFPVKCPLREVKE